MESSFHRAGFYQILSDLFVDIFWGDRFLNSIISFSCSVFWNFSMDPTPKCS